MLNIFSYNVFADLTLDHTVEHNLLKQVQAVTQLKSGKIAVATGTGLHLLNAAGTRK